jgi:hypothetical protein
MPAGSWQPLQQKHELPEADAVHGCLAKFVAPWQPLQQQHELPEADALHGCLAKSVEWSCCVGRLYVEQPPEEAVPVEAERSGHQ